MITIKPEPCRAVMWHIKRTVWNDEQWFHCGDPNYLCLQCVPLCERLADAGHTLSEFAGDSIWPERLTWNLTLAAIANAGAQRERWLEIRQGDPSTCVHMCTDKNATYCFDCRTTFQEPIR